MVNQGPLHTTPGPICTLVSVVGMCVCPGFLTSCDLSLRSAIVRLALFTTSGNSVPIGSGELAAPCCQAVLAAEWLGRGKGRGGGRVGWAHACDHGGSEALTHRQYSCALADAALLL